MNKYVCPIGTVSLIEQYLLAIAVVLGSNQSFLKFKNMKNFLKPP